MKIGKVNTFNIVTYSMKDAKLTLLCLAVITRLPNPILLPQRRKRVLFSNRDRKLHTRVGTLIVATIYLQLIQNRYMFRCFNVLQCSRQHCVQTVASDVEVVG